MRFATTAVLAGLMAALPGLAPSAHGHATYNVSGYGSGIGGSTNGADGSPTSGPSATWTSGPVAEYVGALPANWYCGLHNATQVRSIQTGVAPNPPSGSQLAQVISYNGTNDPDLATDTVLAVGGLSWSDPSNGDQGWGHGLDYGLIHVTPLDTVLAGGPVKLTITLADDPTDGVAVRLAYALYGGWDTSATSTRHQTFITSPSPVDNPLGSAGLTLIDFAIAPAAGQTLSRSYDVTPAYAGEYTLLVAALGGVAGEYQLTAGLFPAGLPSNEQLAQCNADLATKTTELTETTTDLVQAAADLTAAQTEIAVMTSDTDGDGVADQRDACAGSAGGAPVDDLGCSQAQFCGAVAVASRSGRKACKKADWKNDEPLMSARQADCRYDKASQLCASAE
jgi:hypothetical protein